MVKKMSLKCYEEKFQVGSRVVPASDFDIGLLDCIKTCVMTRLVFPSSWGSPGCNPIRGGWMKMSHPSLGVEQKESIIKLS